MARSLADFVNIRSHEGPRVSILYLMAFLFFVGLTWAHMVVEPAFYIHVGAESLALVYAANAIILIAITAVYTSFVDRISNTIILIVVLLLSALAVLLALALHGRDQRLAYLVLYVLVRVVQSAFLIHWWTYVNGFYDTRAAKRVVPVVSSASRLAIIFASLSLPAINRLVSASDIVAVWIGALLIVASVAWLMPFLLRVIGTSDRGAGEAISGVWSRPQSRSQKASYVANVREGYRYVSQSSFLRWMALSTLVMVMIFGLLNFQSGRIFKPYFGSREALSNFYGYLTAGTSLLMFPIEAFLFSRLVGRIGLGNASLIFPLGTLGISGLLIVFPASVAAASLAYFDRRAFRFAIRETSNNLLYNAVPLRVKGRSRAFINGLVLPVGLLLSSGLVGLLRVVPDVWFLSVLLGGLAVAYVVAAMMLRAKYSQALIEMLEREDFSFLLAPASSLAVTDSATLGWLTKKLEESPDSDFTIFVAKLISEVGGGDAVPILADVARKGEPRVRSTVLDILAAAGVRGVPAQGLFTEFLSDPDGRVRRSAIFGLEQLVGAESELYLDRALDLLADADVGVRAQVIPPLARSGDFFYLASAIQALSQLLDDADPHTRAQGVRVLGQVGDVRFVRNLVGYLADPEDLVRLEATLAIESLSRDALPQRIKTLIPEHMTPLVDDPVERVREAAVDILARIDSQASCQVLARFLSDPSPAVREAAVGALVQRGRPAIPVLTPALDDAGLGRRKMATVVLSRIDREQFGGLVETRVDDNLSVIYGNYHRLEALSPYAGCASISVLQRMLGERNTRLTDEIFSLLAAIHKPEAVVIIEESLNDGTARARANAAEALESLTTPRTARLVSPLFDPKLTSAELLDVGKDVWGLAHPDALAVARQLLTAPEDPWLRAVMAFALGEIWAAADPSPFTLEAIEAMLDLSLADPVADVRVATRAARRMIAGLAVTQVTQEEEKVLSTIERIIFLKEVPFFQGMTIDQLKALADICEEELFEEDTRIFGQGDPGGALYVVVSGRVAIEREGQRKGSVVRLATIEAHAYFGEMSLFDQSPRSAAAVAIQDTLTLRLRREPLVALVRQYPGLAMELIGVLSQRLRQTNERIAQLTRSKPRELQKLYDKLG